MTAVDEPATGQRPDLVSVTIDGTEIAVPAGTLVIRAAEMIGTQIKRSTACMYNRILDNATNGALGIAAHNPACTT